MAGEALFVGWGQVVRGREQRALQVFQETIAFYTKLQEDGRIASFDATLLAPHGGTSPAFFSCTANNHLWTHPRERGVPSILGRAGSVVDNVGVVSAYTGDALGQVMGIFGELSQELPQAR